MNENKIAFIICVNDELYYEECCWYLNQLIIPEGIETDIIAVREAESAAEAYNAAMESTDAKYKVYMHQDVFICNRDFISNTIALFRAESQIGMIGVVGGINIPSDGITYNSWNRGRAIVSDWILAEDTCFYQKEPFCYVDALDGMLLVTQYDIPWRSDILKQWHYYDISQSFEFIKAGYRIAVPYQEKPWAVHDCGYSNLACYDTNRKIMFEYYPEFLSGRWEDHPFSFNYELMDLTNQIFEEIKQLIDNGHYKEAGILLNQFEENRMNKNILLLRNIFRIIKMEQESGLRSFYLDKCISTEEAIERYTIIKFFLRRLELTDSMKNEDIIQWLNLNQVTPVEVIMETMNNIANRTVVLETLKKAYLEVNDSKSIQLLDFGIKASKKEAFSNMENNKEITKRKKEAEYWSNYKESSNRTRWWQSPTIIRHYNKTICGKERPKQNAEPIKIIQEKE